MQHTHGFELIREEEIPELNTLAGLYRHVKTNAELLSLQNDDENKVFNITFRTPPADSTGLPHIMEHSVLGGSNKYRVKEPFVELLKGSLKTFVNALTSPDKTSYPIASQNLQDFYNLIDVYLDAVFYPLITPRHLAQEGWHYELESVEDPLVYKGVVFNEMKGSYSSPDTLLGVYSKESLFPDNAYRHSSGGDPKTMPDLAYDQFRAFHETFYHPSNALIFFYGDDPPEARLRLMDECLSAFDSAAVDATVDLQPSFEEPIHVIQPYPVQGGEGTAEQGIVQVNWVLPEGSDPELVMALSILSHALVATPASPLRKALIDSGLGENLTGGGLSTHLRQMTFSVGLKGVKVGKLEEVEPLILDMLATIAESGIDPDMIEAAVNTIEFRLRENNTGRFPRGIALAFRAMGTWLHGGDPIVSLAFARPLAGVKRSLATDPRQLQAMVQTYLLDNSHRSTVILSPDPKLQMREVQAEKEKLAAIRAEMSERDLRKIVVETRELKKFQETADDPEALAAIPTLSLGDLDRYGKTIPSEETHLGNSRLLTHDLFTNGIFYLDLGFDLHTLPQHLLPYVNLFGRALLEMGTTSEDFVKLSQRIGRHTGGISHTTLTAAARSGRDESAFLFLRGKSTLEKSGALLDILRDVLLTVNLDNRERFLQIVRESKASKEASLVPGGHGVVDTRLRSHFTLADWAAEQMSGITYLFFLRELEKEVERDWPSVLENLEQVRTALTGRRNLVLNVTADASSWRQVEQPLAGFVSSLPEGSTERPSWLAKDGHVNEGLTIPAKINYVAKGANLYELGYQLNGSVSVITNLLRTGYLWDKVRVQGGAYGGFVLFGKQSGVLSYLSYRDPNLLETIDVYDGAADYLRQLELSQDELVKGIIGAIGGIDAYELPDAKGYSSMIYTLIGESDEERQQYREEVLSTTAADFRSFAEVLSEARETGHVVAMGSSEAITAVNQIKDGWLNVTKLM